jgi:N-acetylgalactosamine-6-sulfatase
MKQIKRNHLKNLLIGTGSLCCASSPAFTASLVSLKDRPNIVFIFADDWGYGDLGVHGSTFCKTPNLDRMAAEGIDFQNFTVAHPVCSPSRTAVMTGHYPARHSIHQHFATLEHSQEKGMPDWLDPELVMLPRLFKEAGYKTAHFGKWHLCVGGIQDAPLPGKYGYDETAVWNGPGTQLNPANSSIFDKTVEFINRHKDQPFFLNVWLHQTHTPFYPKENYLSTFEHLDERERVYAAVVAEDDHGIGRIMQALDELNLKEKTLIVFSSDNGPEEPSIHEKDRILGSGMGLYYSVGSTGGCKGRKRSLYEGGIRVPFIVRWPGKTPSGMCDDSTVINAVDLLPTFCSAAGIALPAGYEPDGKDMLNAFRGEKVDRTRPIFWEWIGPAYAAWGANPAENINWPRLAVRSGEWKLLMTYDGSRRELYRISEDEKEQENLAGEFPEVVSQLSGMALKWKESLPEEPPTNCISAQRTK